MKRAEKKPAFRTQVSNSAESVCNKPLQRLNDAERSHLLTWVYVQEIARKLNPALLPDDEEDLQDCFLDGTGDAAIGAIGGLVDSDIVSRNFGSLTKCQEALSPRSVLKHHRHG